MTINPNQLTPDAIHTIDVAANTARERHSPFLDLEHLLVGALETDLVVRALAVSATDAETLRQTILADMSIVRETPLDHLNGLTKDATAALGRSNIEAQRLNVSYINSGHILLSIFDAPSPFLSEIFAKFPQLDIEKVRTSIGANSTPPSEMFLQRWRPQTWENAKILGVQPRLQAGRPSPNAPRFVMTTSTAQKRAAKGKPQQAQNNAVIWIALGLLALVIYGAIIRPSILVPVTVVLGGWIISLVLHEFAHALVAYWGGDYTVVQKGYLSLNPLKYMHPLLSIGLPILFLAMGGIGLPGGAVYIETHRLRNKWWRSAVSAAGPFANFICLIIFSTPFWTGYVTFERYLEREVFWASLAFLVWLQAIAILFNLIPLPPLDGFGIIEPFLDQKLAFQMRSMGSLGLLLVIMMFWLPTNESAFDPAGEFLDQADQIVEQVDVEPWQRYEGWLAFRFWRDD